MAKHDRAALCVLRLAKSDPTRCTFDAYGQTEPEHRRQAHKSFRRDTADSGHLTIKIGTLT